MKINPKITYIDDGGTLRMDDQSKSITKSTLTDMTDKRMMMKGEGNESQEHTHTHRIQ